MGLIDRIRELIDTSKSGRKGNNSDYEGNRNFTGHSGKRNMENDIIINEIFETISSYLALFRLTEDNNFFIKDLSHKVEMVEHIRRSDIIGKYIYETKLSERTKLVELLNHLRITGEPHKLAASAKGDNSEGYYMGFVLSNNDFVITWEPGTSQKPKETGITDHTKSEDHIIREKAFLEELIDSTPEAIVITDIPGKITLVNKEFTNLFGYNAEEAMDKYIDDLVVPDEFKDEAVEINDLAVHNRKEIRQTIRHDKYGKRIHVSLIASTVVVSNVTVAHLGIYRDIRTERKNQLIQEILFNISTAALKQYDIKDIYPTIVLELNKIWDTNNFYIALYDKVTNTISLPFFSDEKDNFNEIPAKGTITAWVIANNQSVLLKENDLLKMEEDGDVEMVGTPCKVWMGVPLRVEGEIIGVIVLQDYHSEDKFSSEDLNVLDFIANQIATAIQRRTMLDNLIIARQKAEEAAQSKQTFMSTMSHEIRTPLNEVIGITNLLIQGNPREDQMDLIKTLRFSGNHLMTLVNDVLDYNKMESGKFLFEQTQFNFIDFLEEIKRSYTFRAKEKKLDFDIIKDRNLPVSVIGDPIRLNQILSNLLSNALKFTMHGEIKVHVAETKRRGNHSNIEFKIIDTGIGIPKDKQSDIFDSFTQASADTTRRFGGTGLGLAISKKLIEFQGGTIKVESEPDKGSTFIFNLNIIVSEQQVQTSPSVASETHKELEGKRILVAEDNKINFFVANKFLIGWGMIVAHAENGRLALDMIEIQDFDMILMDLHMPVMDGIEASRIIRNSQNPKIKDIHNCTYGRYYVGKPR
jgi:PAS domain S-box-containing protein